MDRTIRSVHHMRGTLSVPGDKSISHRALMLASIADGDTKIVNLAPGRDVRSTEQCLASLGIPIENDGSVIIVRGKGPHGFRSSGEVLDVGNSGTTLRLLAGLLAAQPFESILTGDASIRRRPMLRIVDPLRQMGARIEAKAGGTAPVRIRGGRLHPLIYATPMPSAQVKSCVLLAGLYASGKTTVQESAPSRDHTERMLPCFGVDVEREDLTVRITGPARLSATPIDVPGDISSAAFFIAAGVLIARSHLIVRDVGINPTRTGFIEVLQRMGGEIYFKDERLWNDEPRADIEVEHSRLKGCLIGGTLIPRIIDEIPILAVVATQAEGKTVIRDARELRVKETDRIRAVARNLIAMGIDVEELEDGLIIDGPQTLRGGTVDSTGDHRIAMAFAVAGLAASGETLIRNAECVDVSYPGYFETLERLGHA